jgi:5-histidylcysteine sulfoxide synthase/putative 4-mercaptohistidine N1-methyltranferase
MNHATISLNGNDIQKKRQEIKEYFNLTYDTYEKLFESLKNDEAFYERANSLRHPLIFYFGHTATFFINKLIIAKTIDKRIDPKLESIFAVGVDEMSWDDLNETHYSWPSVKETQEYRDSVRAVVNKLIDTLPLSLPIDWDSPFWAILMGCEHERIHIETSSVLIRQLDIKYVQPIDGWEICKESDVSVSNELLDVNGAKLTLGKDDDFYGWDNEYGSKEVDIPDFKASKYLVSNGEFLNFVEAGGYENDSYWEEEGREWRDFEGAKYPTFWIKQDNGYLLRVMTEIISLPLSHPVEVNYHEAKAYCNWLSEKDGIEVRLPSEDEWYALVKHVGLKDGADANINLKECYSTTAVDRFAHGEFFDVVGNVWQWTQTPIYPFEGFKVHPIYDDFTTPTFDTKHNLMKGGSWISTGNEALLSARFAFRRHFFQHVGFRYVQSSYKEKMINSYESDELVSQYAEFGWGKEHFGVENYSKACAKLAIDYMGNNPKYRALDIGCAIGRSTFELAKVFDEVVGVDYTARFIELATRMKEEGSISFSVAIEGEIVEYKSVSLKSLGLEHEADKISFWQGDACNLKPLYKGYDLIFASNLIDRLYSPKKFLDGIQNRLNDSGMLILTSPYTWLEEYTPKDEWLGGYKKDGENFSTLDGLKEILDPYFILVDIKDVPFVIAETARKHQHTVAQMSVWKKR